MAAHKPKINIHRRTYNFPFLLTCCTVAPVPHNGDNITDHSCMDYINGGDPPREGGGKELFYD